MTSILFAWELGGGRGHQTTLARLAAPLLREGCRVVAAIRPGVHAGDLLAAGIETLTAPVWPAAARTAADIRAMSSATMGDMLGEAGLADPVALGRLLDGWDAILQAVQPDLVVADYAPAAALAARGRVPLLLTGNGFVAPPGDMPRFPPLHRAHPPRLAEPVLLETINTALGARQRPLLDRLPRMFAADDALVLILPIVDPYHVQRTRDVDGPLLDTLPVPRARESRRIFAYLSSAPEREGPLIAALTAFGPDLDLYASTIGSDELAPLAAAGARIFSRRPPSFEVLQTSRLVIHGGGSGLACEALLAGVPQLILSSHIEQELTGRAVAAHGCGAHFTERDPAAIRDAIASGLADDAIAEHAATLGVEQRAFMATRDPLRAFVAACRRLAG